MARTKAVKCGLDELRWLKISEAMAWSRCETKEKFFKKFPNVHLYQDQDREGSFLIDKNEIDKTIIKNYRIV